MIDIIKSAHTDFFIELFTDETTVAEQQLEEQQQGLTLPPATEIIRVLRNCRQQMRVWRKVVEEAGGERAFEDRAVLAYWHFLCSLDEIAEKVLHEVIGDE